MSCSADMSGSAQSRMKSWMEGTSLVSSSQQILTDIKNIKVSIKGDDLSSLHSLCVVLGNDVQDANGNLPSPNTAVTNELTLGYSQIYNLTISCYKATTKSQIESEVTSMNNSYAQIQDAVSVGNAIVGSN
ncbi:MAG: hypothetical protein HKL80_00780 [Acidimicrobiales bacterium]|nr:hypothetical protein [Acidimicrobiales bacterium]